MLLTENHIREVNEMGEISKKQIHEILSGRAEDGTVLSIEERIAALPPDLIVKAFDTHAKLAEESSHNETIKDVVCRLFASGMTAAEIIMILNVKSEVVDDTAKYQKELIAKYAKQLKGRQQRAIAKLNGAGGADSNDGK